MIDLLLTKQNKKYELKPRKKQSGRPYTWRCSDEPPSEVGQLLYYLLAAQLRHVQLFVTDSTNGEPTPLLGLFMEEGKVCQHNLVPAILMSCPEPPIMGRSGILVQCSALWASGSEPTWGLCACAVSERLLWHGGMSS